MDIIVSGSSLLAVVPDYMKVRRVEGLKWQQDSPDTIVAHMQRLKALTSPPRLFYQCPRTGMASRLNLEEQFDIWSIISPFLDFT